MATNRCCKKQKSIFFYFEPVFRFDDVYNKLDKRTKKGEMEISVERGVQLYGTPRSCKMEL